MLTDLIGLVIHKQTGNWDFDLSFSDTFPLKIRPSSDSEAGAMYKL